MRKSGTGANQTEMLRVANLVTNPSSEQFGLRTAQNGGSAAGGDNGPAVTSADIRQIKMNYLQHNKNQVAANGGPVMAKNLEGKAGS